MGKYMQEKLNKFIYRSMPPKHRNTYITHFITAALTIDPFLREEKYKHLYKYIGKAKDELSNTDFSTMESYRKLERMESKLKSCRCFKRDVSPKAIFKADTFLKTIDSSLDSKMPSLGKNIKADHLRKALDNFKHLAVNENPKYAPKYIPVFAKIYGNVKHRYQMDPVHRSPKLPIMKDAIQSPLPSPKQAATDMKVNNAKHQFIPPRLQGLSTPTLSKFQFRPVLETRFEPLQLPNISPLFKKRHDHLMEDVFVKRSPSRLAGCLKRNAPKIFESKNWRPFD